MMHSHFEGQPLFKDFGIRERCGIRLKLYHNVKGIFSRSLACLEEMINYLTGKGISNKYERQHGIDYLRIGGIERHFGNTRKRQKTMKIYSRFETWHFSLHILEISS